MSLTPELQVVAGSEAILSASLHLLRSTQVSFLSQALADINNDLTDITSSITLLRRKVSFLYRTRQRLLTRLNVISAAYKTAVSTNTSRLSDYQTLYSSLSSYVINLQSSLAGINASSPEPTRASLPMNISKDVMNASSTKIKDLNALQVDLQSEITKIEKMILLKQDQLNSSGSKQGALLDLKSYVKGSLDLLTNIQSKNYVLNVVLNMPISDVMILVNS